MQIVTVTRMHIYTDATKYCGMVTHDVSLYKYIYSRLRHDTFNRLDNTLQFPAPFHEVSIPLSCIGFAFLGLTSRSRCLSQDLWLSYLYPELSFSLQSMEEEMVTTMMVSIKSLKTVNTLYKTLLKMASVIVDEGVP